MTLIQVSQISLENEVCGVKWRNFYSNMVNSYPYRFGGHIWPVDQNGASVIFAAMLILEP